MAAGDPREWVTWKYTTDRAVEYSQRISKYITDQVDGSSNVLVGGAAADGTEEELPDSIRPRVALCYNSTKKLARRVICFSHTAPIYQGTSTTINLACGHPTAVTAFTVYGYEGERTRKSRVGL